METKLVVVSKDGVVGGGFHVLNDDSNVCFTTDIIGEFIRYVGKQKSVEIHYSRDTVSAWPTDVENVRSMKRVAVCSMRPSNWLARVLPFHATSVPAVLDKKLNEEQAEKFLRDFAKRMDSAGTDLLANVRNLCVEKKVTFVKSKDRAGNFSYQYTCESGEKNGFVPPQQIVVRVPVFLNHPDEIRIVLEVDFEFVTEEKSQKASGLLTFSCVGWEDQLATERKRIVEEYLEGIDVEKYWGTLDVSELDDSWKYLPNPIRVSDR